MRNQFYFRCLDYIETNVSDNSEPLLVNCAGLCVMNRSFRTRKPAGREDFYILYLVSGDIRIWIDQNEYFLRPGQFILFYPKTPYNYESVNTKEIVYYWLHFTGSEAQYIVEKLGIPDRQIIDIGIKEEIISHFEALFKEFIFRDDAFQYATSARLNLILTLLKRSMQANRYVNLTYDKSIFKSLDYIHKNYNTAIMLEKLAGTERFSASKYRKLFKKYTGVSPYEYIISLRINRACALLTQTDLSVREVSEAVGYPDQLYFSRIFKKRLGVSPTEYKKVAAK